MRAGRLKGNTADAGVLITATVLLLGILLLAYGYFQQGAVAFATGLAVTVIGVVGGILQVTVLAKRRSRP